MSRCLGENRSLDRGHGEVFDWATVRLGERAILKAVKATRAVSRRVAEIAAKDKKLVRLNPDLIKFHLRSLPLDQARDPELAEGRL